MPSSFLQRAYREMAVLKKEDNLTRHALSIPGYLAYVSMRYTLFRTLPNIDLTKGLDSAREVFSNYCRPARFGEKDIDSDPLPRIGSGPLSFVLFPLAVTEIFLFTRTVIPAPIEMAYTEEFVEFYNRHKNVMTVSEVLQGIWVPIFDVYQDLNLSCVPLALEQGLNSFIKKHQSQETSS